MKLGHFNVQIVLIQEFFSQLTIGIFFRLEDAVDEQKKVKVMTVTQTLVDGKVVSSTTETKERKL